MEPERKCLGQLNFVVDDGVAARVGWSAGSAMFAEFEGSSLGRLPRSRADSAKTIVLAALFDYTGPVRAVIAAWFLLNCHKIICA